MLKDQLNILLVEDDGEDYLLIEDLLHVNYNNRVRLTWADSFCSVKQIADFEQFDAFLIDYFLTDSTGIEVIRYLEHQMRRKSPFILLTGKSLADFQDEFPEADATDFLRKTFLTSDALDRSIQNAILKTFYENQLETLRRELQEIRESSIQVEQLHSAFAKFAPPFQRLCDQLLVLLQNSEFSPAVRESFLESIKCSTFALNEFHFQFQNLEQARKQAQPVFFGEEDSAQRN